MKNLKLNPAATTIELTIDSVSMSHLETEGWDFDNYYSNYEKANEGLDFNQAKQQIQENHTISLFVSNENGLSVREALHNVSSNQTYDSNGSGDTDQSIKDIIALIESGHIVIDSDSDYSTDENGDYVPTFLKA